MASLLNRSETPNLLELVEAHDASMVADIPICCDDATDNIPSRNLSLCADELESDARLKTEIEQVGTTVYGLPLYHFRYKNGTERFQGVMAQDVLKVMPDAVVVGEDGYYRVRYAELGIRMARV
jgi:hypothetical protein